MEIESRVDKGRILRMLRVVSAFEDSPDGVEYLKFELSANMFEDFPDLLFLIIN